MSQEEEQAQPHQEQSTQPFRYMNLRCRFAEERDTTFLPREQWGGFLNVYADRDEREHLFLVPSNLLAKASVRFSNVILTDEPPDLDFRDEDVVVFSAFVNWLLERQLPNTPDDDLPRFDGTGDTAPMPLSPMTPATPATPASVLMPPPRPPHHFAAPQNISQYLLLLIDLHVFADAWRVAMLKIAATNALAEALARWWIYPAPELRYIYRVTRPGSQLRRLAAMRALHGWEVFVVWRQRGADLDADFVADVEELRERLGPGQRGHDEWCQIDLCQFHDHRTIAANGDH